MKIKIKNKRVFVFDFDFLDFACSCFKFINVSQIIKLIFLKIFIMSHWILTNNFHSLLQFISQRLSYWWKIFIQRNELEYQISKFFIDIQNQ
jgi:hypothetical protein